MNNFSSTSVFSVTLETDAGQTESFLCRDILLRAHARSGGKAAERAKVETFHLS